MRSPLLLLLAVSFVLACTHGEVSEGEGEGGEGEEGEGEEGEGEEGEGEGEAPCDPVEIDFVLENNAYAVYLRGCGCTGVFATDGGCIQRNRGDSDFCGCAEVPSLTALAVIDDSGEQSVSLDEIILAGGVARIPRSGEENLTVRVASCSLSGDISVIAPLFDAPICEGNEAPTTCTVNDEAAEHAHVCEHAGVLGTTCCEVPSGVVDVAAPDVGSATENITVSAVDDVGVLPFGNLTLHLWRSADSALLDVP